MEAAAVRGGGIEGDHEEGVEAYAVPLKNVLVFKYLGWVMTAGDDECPAVVGNLQRARKSCGRV